MNAYKITWTAGDPVVVLAKSFQEAEKAFVDWQLWHCEEDTHCVDCDDPLSREDVEDWIRNIDWIGGDVITPFGRVMVDITPSEVISSEVRDGA